MAGGGATPTLVASGLGWQLFAPAQPFSQDLQVAMAASDAYRAGGTLGGKHEEACPWIHCFGRCRRSEDTPPTCDRCKNKSVFPAAMKTALQGASDAQQAARFVP